jgi:P4 family phage/plasmid primase-like protien
VAPASGTDTAEKRAPLIIGSDVEVAQHVAADLKERFGHVVDTEGAFWRYNGIHWESMSDHEMRRAVYRYDGAPYMTPAGSPSCVRLGRGRINSIINECRALLAEPNFFERRPAGINCATGFIRFSDNGTPAIEPHHPDHRARHVLAGGWRKGAVSRPPSGSLLFKLLDGVFRGETDAAEKVILLSEVCGVAALGYATRLIEPRVVILHGEEANNGKGQILDLARSLLPPNAVCSLPPAKMGDERHIVGLVGKLLNATDELSAAAIASDRFKSVVTGDPLHGRDVYRPRIEFRSQAQNLYAANILPPFHGGMDKGVQRRLIVIPFNRVIPIEERIEHIGQRVAEQEADLLLAWAVEGAARIIRNRTFTIPASCKQALMEWVFAADPVLIWLHECVQINPAIEARNAIATRTAYAEFRRWAAAEGFDKLPAINGFVQRVRAGAPGIEHRRTAKGRQFLGMTIHNATVSS